MQQARYSTLEAGHFGLASENYTHFTSPIRRFPDLMVHLLVKKESDKSFAIKDGERLLQRLPMIAEHSSIKEREAQSAERESVDVKVCEYMTRHIGEEFDAIVSGVTQFGIFVELENTAEGLIHISMLEGDYFTFNKDDLAIVGVKTGIKYKLGRQVRVRLKRVKIGQRQLDFELLADKTAT
jgi:ribonuclease R